MNPARCNDTALEGGGELPAANNSETFLARIEHAA